MSPGDEVDCKVTLGWAGRDTMRAWCPGYVVVAVREQTILVRELARDHLAAYPHDCVRPTGLP